MSFNIFLEIDFSISNFNFKTLYFIINETSARNKFEITKIDAKIK